ncbi:hypothetical protein AA309_16580 [Microvirga vignae]|uniref:Uncharacterized protein n=1 Tax=Microvirga vignae TaxID=1225564 RepID=A0A0H1RA20_9HYPH|nr:hypothetical protein [Microvirga vignae]KLK92038.1 hypothetical protein AA309_16580 [Microvirga vignae]
MFTNLAISLLAILAGSLGMLLLLIVWFGGRTIEPELESGLDPIRGEKDQAAIYDTHGPFIPMPDHLRTADEMIAWMTQELPKITADPPK